MISLFMFREMPFIILGSLEISFLLALVVALHRDNCARRTDHSSKYCESSDRIEKKKFKKHLIPMSRNKIASNKRIGKSLI